ncbi:MAG: tRNA (cytidine(56)-2'-O)-methyltransferase [Candidatus Aenigmatarchaeota archaeon]|nr:MAG: tRNA (cytidine(56)-2'-O)-methyltransferase [Candidatus Aenigmarchaeota archaeon]
MITILRLGHRIFRDQRITTHCALAGRALGADGMVYTGQKDRDTEDSVRKVAEQWGGKFSIRHSDSYKGEIDGFRGISVHLTVYGMPFQEKMAEIRRKKDIMLIVGGEKVPPDVYEKSDYNLAVTSQPHSEIASLALFLHEYFQGKELGKRFPSPRLKVVPQAKGKMVKKA